jgi:flagellar biosynthetic protein FliO
MDRGEGGRAIARAVTVIVIAGALSCLAASPIASPTLAPTTIPTAVSQGAVENEAIRRTHVDPRGVSAATTQQSSVSDRSTSQNAFDVRRVAMALIAVLALIVVLRWIAKRFFTTPGAGRSSRAIQVLSRAILSPKQQLMVVQVGRRLIVVGDTGAQMSPLCEIRDPDEVAELVGQITQEKGDSISKTFGQLFGRAKTQFDEDESEASPAKEPSSGGALSDDRDPPVMAETRNELAGLADRIRLLSRQFRGS